MKALSALKSAINQGSIFGIMALILLAPVLYPKLALAAEPQTSGQPAQVLQIKITDSNLLNQNNTQIQTASTTSLTMSSVVKADPLNTDLQQYLASYNSPLQNYTTQLLDDQNWKTIVAISFVESNMCVHNLNYNCSGIGGPGHFLAFKDFGGWIDCMNNLLTTRYSGWTLDQMDGVYVQPKSANWAYGSKKIMAQLDALEQQANQQRQLVAQAQVSQNTVTAALATFPEMAN